MSKQISSCFFECTSFIRLIKKMIFYPLPDLCKTAFADYPNFISYIRSELDSELEKQVEKAKTFLKELTELDNTVFTLNSLYSSIVKNLTAYCNIVIQSLKDNSVLSYEKQNQIFSINSIYPLKQNDKLVFNNKDSFNMNDMIEINNTTIVKSMTIFKSKTDYDLELAMLISMFAYWNVFSRKFTDYLFLCTQKYLFIDFINNFKTYSSKTQSWIE